MGDKIILAESKDYIQYQAMCNSKVALAFKDENKQHLTKHIYEFVLIKLSPVKQDGQNIFRYTQYIQFCKQPIFPRVVLMS